MNRPSRTDEPQQGEEGRHNQNPPPQFSNDTSTNSDLNGISNSRTFREGGINADSTSSTNPGITIVDCCDGGAGSKRLQPIITQRRSPSIIRSDFGPRSSSATPYSHHSSQGRGTMAIRLRKIKKAIVTFTKFVGPGFMVAVAYIDPGNYATDVAAGASYQYRLLFVVLLSNIFAIFLQSLSIKLGTISGLNLAEACRVFLPGWLNYGLYGMAEIAIIATDIAEVIGTAIALNLLVPKIPLVAGCALSILEVMLILVFYRPNGSMHGLRLFEYFVMMLVLTVVVCFCIQLSLIKDTTAGEVFRGYLPSKFLVEQTALYQACGILGATVMPHSLYLGSGIVQARLYDYDNKSGLLPPVPDSSAENSINGGDSTAEDERKDYIPSLAAIKHSLKYTYAELAISLFTFALFVNSAILIVAGASLYKLEGAVDQADLFGIHELLSRSIAPAAGTIFALALLFSGVSAGIVCTIAGQMVSEGALRWTLKPWLRRLVTRSISVVPSIIIAAAVGREGLNAALNGSQVVLSIVLPFITAPLIFFTSLDRYMMVCAGGFARWGNHYGTEEGDNGRQVHEEEVIPGFVGRVKRWFKGGWGCGSYDEESERRRGAVKMANSWWVASFGILVWCIMTVMNVANLVLLGKE
ncbi:natural resistance-associated macrophage protein-domain-containing protein [Podospora fimiseda]|uniref:Natural resistance-associated macrophage protein-domain-containing protein n=1 Tax=Podospora fimiseda TaxID=252190 RepID=A0AAN7H1T8_9PEZI|nr:natural resistance-associated macrophage protein-domain-containing protein [Podospora fimiseda]